MSTPDTFWANPTRTVPSGDPILTHDSTGDQQDGPIDIVTNGAKSHLPGTTAGAIPAGYTTAAQRVYPWTIDFTNPTELAQYNDFVANKMNEFSSWHSAYQARYLAANGGFYAIPTTASRTSPDPLNPPDAAYLLANDGRTVINIMGLGLSDYQRLPAADKQHLESEPIFTTIVAKTLGLDVTAGSQARQGVVNLLDEVNSSTFMSTDNKKVFAAQVQLLLDRLDESKRVATQTVLQEVSQIRTRFQLADAFSKAVQRPEVNMQYIQFDSTENNPDRQRNAILTNPGVAAYAISSDGMKSVTGGLDVLMRAEREMLTAATRRVAISRNNQIHDPKADVANLIYQLQLMYQSEANARSDFGTEEMSQLHRLLSDYAIMQRLVNETLKYYNPKDTEEKRRFLNIGGKNDGGVDTDQGSDDSNNILIYDYGGAVTRIEDFPNDRPGNSSADSYNRTPAFHWHRLLGSGLGEAAQGLGDQIITDGDGDLVMKDSNTVARVWFQESDKGFTDNSDDIKVQTGGLSKEEMRVVGMFAKDKWGSGTYFQAHPLETIYGAPRQLQELTDTSKDGFGSLRLERRDYWDKWSTQLADTVTILNQKNQLKQNEIENNTKEANRHFDLGNNALRKMNEMLMSIARM